LVTIDTLRADAPGFSGERGAQTPVIDRLAAAGVRFQTAYAHNTVTLPSHANILSGRLPIQHGVHDNAGARFPQRLDTIATLLKPHGYRTAAFVSAFPLDSRFGLARGFDVYDDRLSGAAGPAFLEQERRGPATVALARDWIRTGGAQPYFCWVHLFEPHFPYRPDYNADVAAADSALAPLLEPILSEGARGRTIVVFTADHGESLGEHGEATHGIFAYDATLRVPLVMYAPWLWAARVVPTPASHVDLLPTLLEALHIAAPKGLDGESLVRSIRGERQQDRPLYFEALSGMLNRGWAPLRGVVSRGFKYIDLPIPELYDLAKDPAERQNLAERSAEQVAALRRVLQGFPLSRAQGGAARLAEDADTRQRLRSLGYASGSAPTSRAYTPNDDPKKLIALDGMLQEVIGLYLDGRLQEAIARCRELVARRPQMPISLLHLAHLEREAGNLAGGIDALRRALALNPRDAETASLLAAYLTEARQPGEAVKVLGPFVARPEPDPQVLSAHAIALARLGRADDAVREIERARASDPTNGALLVQKGTIELMAGRTDRARAAFTEALAVNPDLPRAHSSLGALAAEEGDRGAALDHWRHAVAIDPGEFRTVLGVSIGLIQRGRGAEARPYLEYFVASAPEVRYASDLARARQWLATH
jgi:arylsulfatase A-like enzyme/Flp pilus assembly protein TadD